MTEIAKCKYCGKVHSIEYTSLTTTPNCERHGMYNIHCSNEECFVIISSKSKDIVIREWNELMKVKE